VFLISVLQVRHFLQLQSNPQPKEETNRKPVDSRSSKCSGGNNLNKWIVAGESDAASASQMSRTYAEAQLLSSVWQPGLNCDARREEGANFARLTSETFLVQWN